MTCSSCGATIADKAIVCYRCGTPTAIPSSVRPDRAASGAPATSMVPGILLVLVGVVVVAVTLASDTVSGSVPSGRTVGTLLGVALAVAGGWFLARRRSPKA